MTSESKTRTTALQNLRSRLGTLFCEIGASQLLLHPTDSPVCSLGSPVFTSSTIGYDALSLATINAATSIDPSTGRVIARYPFDDEAKLDATLARALAGFQQWREVPVTSRCTVLAKMGELLQRDIESLALRMTAEMGKPIVQAREEVAKTAAALQWYAEHGAAMLEDQPTTVGPDVYVSYRPLGTILSVQPWNFPIWQPMRAAAAILLAGNSYVLKPAPNVVGSALDLERLWNEAGLPDGSFTVLNAEPELVSRAISAPTIAAVTVTGSVRAGSAIAAQAGREIKKSVLELGGTDAFIVLSDADIDAAVEAAVASRFQNNGQICIAAKRIILEESIRNEFVDKFVARVGRLTVGHPKEESTYVGPIARADIRDELSDQVKRTVEQGGTVLVGGNPVPGAGNFFEPTVIDGVRPGMAAFDEEVFGPVAALVTARDAEEAVELANQSEYGLSASVWTRNMTTAKDVAARLGVGGVFVNKISVSDPRIPIGGVKKSGFGRELSSYGVHEFTNIQTVWAVS
ncbi:NAD-dependent succinate-semialdehyde dehydrogenase [Rhodococcus opacus]|uniref:NAD-dependent succinate-semialdehyde dehydrogenase n=1 Tax=Rhodococcus opacus TaxID=37919 RepID=A0AAX3Y5H4_RHOOP|nr:NAD-dependent succinate-semialdehyde dehydrogenase [Rhodococcus opacus]MCZ4590001.1 NAD-dependent succinate-semialdehyde dehydrogenase [Rhodococcus opacus]WLF44526.1 NAD-dependent succinate-semialdehyde dehydrogenase [Rhodococcus opacus]